MNLSTHTLDETETAYDNLAKILSLYHKSLLDVGIKEPLADQLVIQYQGILLIQMKVDNGK